MRYSLLARTRGLKTNSDIDNVILAGYSKGAFRKYASISERINFLVSFVEASTRPAQNKRLLALGPRFESEIYGYYSMNYLKENVHAVDTFSYSNKISLGNMHNLQFESDYFDVIVGGWILTYSQDIELALSEIYRVQKVSSTAIFSWDLPVDVNIEELNLSNLFLPTMDGKKHSFNQIFMKWDVTNIFIGNTVWGNGTPVCIVSLIKK
jgi:hypothetical protein